MVTTSILGAVGKAKKKKDKENKKVIGEAGIDTTPKTEPQTEVTPDTAKTTQTTETKTTQDEQDQSVVAEPKGFVNERGTLTGFTDSQGNDFFGASADQVQDALNRETLAFENTTAAQNRIPQSERLRRAILNNPAAFGFLGQQVGQETPDVQGGGSIGSTAFGAFDAILKQVPPYISFSEYIQDPKNSAIKSGLFTAGLAGGYVGARLIGGRVVSGAANTVRAGNVAKEASKAQSALNVLKQYAGGFIAVATGASALSSFDPTRTADEQQQALNTLGQTTSTLVGDATTGTGDPIAAINELRFIRQELLNAEADIQAGKAASAKLKYNGKVYDINADVTDQLRTVDEGIADIQTFIIRGQFPELSEQEIQAQIRILEAEGIIEPVDYTRNRRDISGQ